MSSDNHDNAGVSPDYTIGEMIHHAEHFLEEAETFSHDHPEVAAAVTRAARELRIFLDHPATRGLTPTTPALEDEPTSAGEESDAP